MQEDFNGGGAPEAPWGSHSARCDERGRLKLPAIFAKYLADRNEKRVFITTLDGRTARVYCVSTWLDNERVFLKPEADAEAADAVQFLANHYGDRSDVDGQGRILLPTNLRRDLGLENGTVWLQFTSDGFSLMNDAWYQERLAVARQKAIEGVKKLRPLGLK